MPSGNAVWGIDIGQCALKAVKLRPADEGRVEVAAFDVIEHPKILSQPDADRDELINGALEKFASRNDWQGDQFVVGIPGQQTFARFCKLPPADAKKIHELVRYEASQQIPFDMEDVVWDYQVFQNEESPDTEVGIFAIRKDLIRKHLDYFSRVRIAPAVVQTIPSALYNYSRFELQNLEKGTATVLVDVGAQNTDLIIVEPNSAWTRSIPLGGNSFTEALVRSFKLSFAKAESLKRTAASSKYARQIFQAMRPIFAELVAEIQRSLGFYSSTHRDVELRRVLALGNAFRLPGLQKYLENNLTISGGVSKLEKFERLVATPTVNAPQFTDNILSFAAAYGLALQGLGQGTIRASLLPTELARVVVWKKKTPYFMATAATLVAAAIVPFAFSWMDMGALNRGSDQFGQAQAIISSSKDLNSRYSQASTDTGAKEADIKALDKLQDSKRILPLVLARILEAMPPPNPPQLAELTSAQEIRKLLESDPTEYARTNRRQFFIDSLRVNYVGNIDSVNLAPAAESSSPSGVMGSKGGPTGMPYGLGAQPGSEGMGQEYSPTGQPMDSSAGGTGNPGFVVYVTGRMLYGQHTGEASKWLSSEYAANLRKKLQEPGLGFYMPEDEKGTTADSRKEYIGPARFLRYYGEQTPQPVPPSTPGGPTTIVDPLADPITGESMRTDWKVEFAFKVKLGDMPPATPVSGADTQQPTPPPAAPGGGGR